MACTGSRIATPAFVREPIPLRPRGSGLAPQILTDRGWLSVWHAVEAKEIVGIYRTYWSLMDRDDPSRVIATDEAAILEPSTELTRPIEDQMYLRDVVFLTGIAEHGDH
jgi:predicted GH43/DUF377 family glycosyl hydrolase